MKTLKDIETLKQQEVINILKDALPYYITINSSVLSDAVEPLGNNSYEVYVRCSSGIDSDTAYAIARDLSEKLKCPFDYNTCDRDFDFYLIINPSIKEDERIAESKIEDKPSDTQYVDYFGEEVQIGGDHNFLRNEVAPLLEELGYRRKEHYSWDIHFQRLIVKPIKGSLEFEKGTFKSDSMSPNQSYFKTKEITILDIQKKIEEVKKSA